MNTIQATNGMYGGSNLDTSKDDDVKEQEQEDDTNEKMEFSKEETLA